MMSDQTKTADAGEAPPASDMPLPSETILASAAQQEISGVRRRLQEMVGEVVLAMAQLPRYRHQTLADLNHLVIAPLSRDRIAIATPATGAAIGLPFGIAIWASVSGHVSAKLRGQAKAGAFPVRLDAMDWDSGDEVWLLDILAPSRTAASKVLEKFGAIAQDRPVTIYPVVSGLVDPELLRKLKQTEKMSPGESAI